jgi:multiple sugar transport system substrate-binding protein
MKKKSWVKALLAVFTVSLAAGLTACGNSGSSTKSSGPVKITFWHGMNGPYAKALNSIIKDYNKSQSKYKVVGTAQGDYTALQQKIMAGAKSHKLPTISQTTYTTVPDYVKNGFVEPFDNYIKKSDLSDIYPAFLSSSKYQGKYYSMPFSKSVRIMYYNPTLLKKYNLSVPTSWEEVQKDAAKVKADGLYGISFDKSFDMELEGLAKQNGNKLVSTDLTPNLNSKKTLEATHFIWDMVQNKEAKTAGEDIYGDRTFTSSKALFYVGSSAGISSMKQYAPKGFTWETMALPTYKGKKATELAGNDIVMFKDASAAEKKGGADFIKFLLSKKETIKWSEKTGYVPLTKSAVKDSGYQAFLDKNPADKAAVNSLDFGFQSTAFIGFSEYRTNLLSAVDAMLTKHETPEKAMGTLQTQTKKIIKDNNDK